MPLSIRKTERNVSHQGSAIMSQPKSGTPNWGSGVGVCQDIAESTSCTMLPFEYGCTSCKIVPIGAFLAHIRSESFNSISILFFGI